MVSIFCEDDETRDILCLKNEHVDFLLKEFFCLKFGLLAHTKIHIIYPEPTGDFAKTRSRLAGMAVQTSNLSKENLIDGYKN